VDLTIASATIGIAIALACAWYCRRLALHKGRNVLAWTVLGFVLTVIAVPVLVLLSDVAGRPGPEEEAEAVAPEATAARGEG
jgi:hypothetical protein